jgi:small subunit ribosomal protein S1
MVNQSTGSKGKLSSDVMAILDQADEEILGSKDEKNKTDFAKMFAESKSSEEINVGDVVTGSVVEVQSDFILVDIGYKSEGLIPISEFRIVEGKTSVSEGDEVEVYVEKIENENGMVVLSKDRADMMKAWNDISKAAENQEVIEGMVVAKVKGGLSVDIGVKAFLPGSQIDLRPIKDLDQFIGKNFKFKVIKFNKKRGNIVLSRRVLLEEQRESLRSETLDTMTEGSIVKGMVKNITDYGAFIDLGGVDGLLHITDMSWGRLKHPSEAIEVGEDLELKILKYDTDKERVSLGLKQMKTDPWESVVGNYPVGDKVKGKVVSLAEYGAFVEIGEGVEGLIHVNEMSWTKKIKHPSQILKVGEETDVVVLAIDSENRKISLGLKQLEENPWVEIKSSYEPGAIIEGEVKSITDFGIFVGVEEGIDGLVHISDFSWTKRVNHPSEMYTVGDKIRACVLGVDTENERFSLGVKQLDADPWGEIDQKYPIGSQLDVTVTKAADFGVFVEIEENIEGLIHISELSNQRVENVEDIVKVGDKIKAEIISIDQDARKIGLSSKLVTLREQKANVDDYVKKATATSKTTMGDIFGDALKDMKQDSNSDS